MDQLEHRTIVTKPYNLTYSYYLSPNFNEKLDKSTPTLVFNHGFPDMAEMWAGALPHMLKLPYPFLLMDLLGFGDTSKPTETEKYNYRQQADSIAQILDKEGVPNNVIPIGHDWGSAVSQRFFLYHRQRCVGLSLISLAYQIPSPEPFSLDGSDEATTKRFGYPQWEYWNFFTAKDAPRMLEDNLDRFYEIMHGNYPSPKPEENGRDIWMRKMFCEKDGFRNYINQTGEYKNYTVPLKPYAENTELRRAFKKRLGDSGMTGPVNYYHTLANNTMLEDERALCKKPDNADKKIDVPCLYIGQTGDWVCRTDLMADARDQGLVSDLQEEAMEAGHWVLYENPQEVARLIGEWLQKKFPVKKS